MRHLSAMFRRIVPPLTIYGAVLIASSTLAAADCGRAFIRIHGSADERLSACRALDAVLSYFKEGGLRMEPRLTVRFEPSVVVRTRTSPSGTILASGVYEGSIDEIRVLNSATESAGRPWDAAMAFSVLEHEMIHAVIAQTLGEQYERLPHAWHEALAYAVQIDLMPTGLREALLARYPAEEGFDNTLQINDIVYGLDPDHFAVAAYKTYKRRHDIEFLKKAIHFELEMVDVNDFLP